MYDSLSRELKLVLLCSQINLEEKDVQAINQLLAEPIYWDLFLDLAEHHRVYPLVYRNMAGLAKTAMPAEVIGVLRQRGWKNTAKTLQMTGEFVNIIRIMEENGVRIVVLKGFPLGYILYGNLALRPSKDLDLLVWPKDLDRAINLIENQGYELKDPSQAIISGWLRNWWMKTNHHFEYWHHEKETSIELHWQAGHYGLEIPLNKIEISLVKVKVSGQEMYILGQEELLLYLILHGTGHSWFRLKWLCDVGAMLRQGGFSWVKLYGLAEGLGVETQLNQAVILARYLLHAPVPVNIVERISEDRKALNLASLALPIISAVNYYDPVNIKIIREHKMQLGWRRMVVHLFNKFLLQKMVYFLYYLLRPFILLRLKVMKLLWKII